MIKKMVSALMAGGILFLLTITFSYGEITPLSEKAYVGKWVCESRSLIIYGASPEKRMTKQLCQAPFDILTI